MKSLVVFVLIAMSQTGCEYDIFGTKIEKRSRASIAAAGGAVCGAGTTLIDGVCVALKLQSDDCVDPDLTQLTKGNTLMLCDGTLAEGKLELKKCTSEGEQNCLATETFKVVDTTTLSTKLISTESVAGVTGSVTLPAANDVKSGVSFGVNGNSMTGQKREIKLCRNGADLTTWDAPGITNIGVASPRITSVSAANVDVTNDEISWNPTTYYLENDFPVQLTTSGTMPGGLLASTTYYIITSGSKIKLSETPGGSPIDIISVGTGSLSISPAGDGVVGVWDTVDDFNKGKYSPTQSPWSATNICDDTNFTDVSSTGGPNLTPSGITPTGASEAFSEIWRDDLTGLYFTNILYDGMGTMSWAQGMAMCADLDSGDGAGKWRMPTQKELLQLYIDGVAQVPVAGGNFSYQFLWSSTAQSNSTAASAWIVDLATGSSYADSRNFSSNGVICVR